VIEKIGQGGMGEVLLKGPLASPERHDRAAFEGRSGRERSTERGNSAKPVASQPGVGYPVRARTAKRGILFHRGARPRPSVPRGVSFYDGDTPWNP
ncbi:hypothetical protein MYX78_12930, partial [Acidobacteria bacterium AH-259-G07]|nr:hypothetical protein [Acidobacteria bacterium AH-259-G07]